MDTGGNMLSHSSADSNIVNNIITVMVLNLTLYKCNLI